MIPSKVTRELFAEIRRLIPGLPDRVTSFSLTLSMDSDPVVTCRILVPKIGELTEDSKTFEIREMSGKGESV